MNDAIFITFESGDAPDPRDDAAPAGREIAESIAAQLNAVGLRCTDIGQHDSYGWEWDVRFESGSIWTLLQRSDEWLLILVPRRSIFARLFQRNPPRDHEAVRDAVLEFLRSDARFSDACARTKAEFHAEPTRTDGHDS